jgi:SAM-dependent methyltransferase
VGNRPDAPAARRNREPILDVLRKEFARISTVLEIGSGTGQHAVYFGEHLAHVEWQTSDRSENLAGIECWIADAGLENVRPPIVLDVLMDAPPAMQYAGVFSANTAHIMSMDAVEQMFRIVGEILPARGIFCLYGPFNLDGTFTSESNQRFDASLRRQDPAMGIRDLEDLDRLATHNGLSTARQYAMPANNMISVWEK